MFFFVQHQDVAFLDLFLLQLLQTIHQCIGDGNLNGSTLLAGSELLVWTVKALVLRPILSCKQSLNGQYACYSTDSSSSNWQGIFLNFFLSLLFSSTNRILAEVCANQLTMLLQDPEPNTILSKTTSRGNYALFWQQKLFSLIFPSLQQQVRALSGKESASGVMVNNPVAVLLAVSKIIKGVSHSLLKANFSSFVESIVFVLSYVNVQQQSTVEMAGGLSNAEGEAITALSILIKENAGAFVDHLHVIIPRLIKVCEVSDCYISKNNIRFLFLDCPKCQ